MKNDRIIRDGLTFDDLLLLPGKSNFLPAEADISSWFTREIKLHTPLISAAMDTVTESELAICMAQEGGIGIIHKNMSIQEQASQIDQVKRSESGLITDPITIKPDDTVEYATI